MERHGAVIAGAYCNAKAICDLGNVVRIKAPIKCGDYSEIVDIGNDIPGKQPKTEIRATLRYLHTLPGKPIGIV